MDPEILHLLIDSRFLRLLLLPQSTLCVEVD